MGQQQSRMRHERTSDIYLPPTMSDRMQTGYALTADGAAIAATAGALLGCGLAIFDPKSSMESTLRCTVGGAVLCLGLYMVAPSYYRTAWSR